MVIKSRDGLTWSAYLTPAAWRATRAATAARRSPLPMVLFVHGGPWGRDSWGYNPYHQLLANRGYAVLSVNFRGSTGFGKKFLNAGDHEWAGKMHDDLIDAVDWAVQERRHHRATRWRSWAAATAATPRSAGLTFTPDAFACGVDIVGPVEPRHAAEDHPALLGGRLQQFVQARRRSARPRRAGAAARNARR